MIIINYNYNELIVITIIFNNNSSKLLIIINDGYKEYRNPDFFLIYFKSLESWTYTPQKSNPESATIQTSPATVGILQYKIFATNCFT